MVFLRHTAWLLAKDIRVELRAKELLLSVALFSVVIVLVFSFALASGLRPTMDLCAGMLWTATSLAATIGVGRAFEREREHDTLRGLLLLPISPAAIYVSKLLGIFLLIGFVQLVVGALLVLLFNLHPQHVGPLVIINLVGIVVGGLASLSGAIFGAIFIQFIPNFAEKISSSAPWAIYGVVIIGCVYLLPRGAAGLLESLATRLANLWNRGRSSRDA